MTEWIAIVTGAFLMVLGAASAIAKWVPEWGQTALAEGRIADIAAPWILITVGLILREIKKWNKGEAIVPLRPGGYNPPPVDYVIRPDPPPPLPPKKYDKRGRPIKDD